MALLREEGHAHRRETSLQQLAALRVTRPRILETLVEDDPEASVERVDHRDRSRVVIRAGAFARYVLLDHVEVEIPRLRSRNDAIESARAHRQRRQTRRNAEALLRTAVRDVDAPPVDLERDATQRRHTVDE